MDEQSANIENYDESITKCEKINKLIPSVIENIKKMKMVDKNFEYDFDLEIAEQLLVSLGSMILPTNEEEKIAYVDEFRENLISGLESIGDFFNNLTNLELLNDEQRGKI